MEVAVSLFMAILHVHINSQLWLQLTINVPLFKKLRDIIFFVGQ
jgi:hypothetical protein